MERRIAFIPSVDKVLRALLVLCRESTILPSRTLLCGKRLDTFLALGENGQPVHSAALQLLEVLRRQQHTECLLCLAVPQPNEAGDYIDWYSPREGDVVPWHDAMPEVQATALATLERCMATLSAISQRMQDADVQGQKLFGALLAKAVHFPDNTYLYLVDGAPVVTFWGFEHAHRPRPAASINSAPSSLPVTAVTDTAEQVSSTAKPASEASAYGHSARIPPAADISLSEEKSVRPNARWWWLLLLPMLLLLLWWLRGCHPAYHGGGVGAVSSVPRDMPEVPAIAADGHAMPHMYVPETSTFAPSLAVTQVSARQSDVPGVSEGIVGNAQPRATESEATVLMLPVDVTLPSEEELHLSPHTPTALPVVAPGSPMHTPTLQDVSGHWRAGLGIQDVRTGRPLALDYRLNEGKGSVFLDKGDNVICRAPVQVAVEAGTLTISGQSRIPCADNTYYDTPTVRCAEGYTYSLHCTGHYDAGTTIRMNMTREGE